MADISDAVDVGGAQPKKRTFRKFSYRGVDLDQLLDMGTDELVKLFPARARRRFQRGLKRKPMAHQEASQGGIVLCSFVFINLFFCWISSTISVPFVSLNLVSTR
ncbi:LOW QUALITY PROTEIN: 40S ribosomal protein S15 [Dendrobium catenatum]|uniref:LOW QUALITY PROTEIN: 40S ribosomal protein S15 n=1 Tax=Dendrobium catenatum TaxID=906689 RepID=UPI0010A0564F|nr:LOW QUALITY PROTEIN: 40S ribosomal protein S15 [Dendrobium catenatum]